METPPVDAAPDHEAPTEAWEPRGLELYDLNVRVHDEGATLSRFAHDEAWPILHAATCGVRQEATIEDELTGEQAVELFQREMNAHLEGRRRALVFCVTCSLVDVGSPRALGVSTAPAVRKMSDGDHARVELLAEVLRDMELTGERPLPLESVARRVRARAFGRFDQLPATSRMVAAAVRQYRAGLDPDDADLSRLVVGA